MAAPSCYGWVFWRKEWEEGTSGGDSRSEAETGGPIERYMEELRKMYGTPLFLYRYRFA
jgi:hypothetical protein